MYRKFIWQTVLFVVVVVVEAILQSHHFTNSVTNCNLCEHKVKKKNATKLDKRMCFFVVQTLFTPNLKRSIKTDWREGTNWKNKF